MEHTFIMVTEKQVVKYSSLADLPLIIDATGKTEIRSDIYPLTVHFATNEAGQVMAFSMDGEFFQPGHRAKLDGSLNKSGVYKINLYNPEKNQEIIKTIIIKISKAII